MLSFEMRGHYSARREIDVFLVYHASKYDFSPQEPGQSFSHKELPCVYPYCSIQVESNELLP